MEDPAVAKEDTAKFQNVTYIVQAIVQAGSLFYLFSQRAQSLG